jgi:hypothetical protein
VAQADKKELEERVHEARDACNSQLQNLAQQVQQLMGAKASIADLDSKVGYETLEDSLAVQEKALQVALPTRCPENVCLLPSMGGFAVHLYACMCVPIRVSLMHFCT